MSILKGKTAALISLGCDKNTVDSELMLGAMASAGCTFTADITQAEIIVVNTCGFLQDAVDEAKETIEEGVRQKQAGTARALVITGCAAQRYKKEFFDNTPEIDGVLGVSEYGRIIEVLQQAMGGMRYVDFDNTDSMNDTNRLNRVISTPRHYAYLKIAEGCDKHCTYCTIPKIRGPYKSRDIDSLIKEAQFLADNGAKELVLIAQDTTLYGTDLYGKQVLHELLQSLSKINGIHWLRILYCYPEHIYDELITEIAENSKVLPYIDMPIQHASDVILPFMGRKTTRFKLRQIITKLREAVPDLTLRTTLIAGFPGETKADFTCLCDFIEEIGFDRLGVFAYSREEGTAADKLPGHLPEKTKINRKDRLMKIQQEISAQKLAQKIGKTIEVCIEGIDNGKYYGRSHADAPEIDGLVYIICDKSLKPGNFVSVHVTGSTEYDLLGELL